MNSKTSTPAAAEQLATGPTHKRKVDSDVGSEQPTKRQKLEHSMAWLEQIAQKQEKQGEKIQTLERRLNLLASDYAADKGAMAAIRALEKATADWQQKVAAAVGFAKPFKLVQRRLPKPPKPFKAS